MDEDGRLSKPRHPRCSQQRCRGGRSRSDVLAGAQLLYYVSRLIEFVERRFSDL